MSIQAHVHFYIDTPGGEAAKIRKGVEKQMPNETNPQTISEERAIELINAMIDQMFNDAGGDTQEVINKLFRVGFTEKELVGTFYLQESDVAACLDAMDDDEEVE